ncbi:hypothetical protein CYMTET_29445 [Cymbomonas tetramitiformis]|uniref:CCHC-type domain-containing protein n=1 Tax=Cymbomonas tetramitiformis TaxID=36881 RepID=A0AAE0FL24_9CHLO|nr:hypothetical protein CYMTET_29445 [Cymbomonas tetramitiformis]
MRRLWSINLDVSKPQDWEEKVITECIPGTHNALLKIREIAEEAENDMEAEAQRRPSDRSATARFVNPPPRTQQNFFRCSPQTSSRPALAMLEGVTPITAAAAVTPPAPPGLPPNPEAPKIRRCFACGSADHIVRNCTDERSRAAGVGSQRTLPTG